MANWRKSGALALLLVSLIACFLTWIHLSRQNENLSGRIWTWTDSTVSDAIEDIAAPAQDTEEAMPENFGIDVTKLYELFETDVELDEALGIGYAAKSRQEVLNNVHALMEQTTANFGKCPGARSEGEQNKNDPRVLVIHVWTGISIPNYLHHMMESVASTDTDRVHLLNVVVSLKDDGCKSFESIPGQSTVCLTSGQMNFLVADGMCEHWASGCTTTEFAQVLDLLNFHVGKSQQGLAVSLRALYGQTFRQYLASCGYSHWAWIDSDTIFGSWDRLLPWSLLPEFDIIHFSMPGDAECMYTRGQLSIMKVDEFSRNLWSLEKGLQNTDQFLEKFGPLASPSPIQYEERSFTSAVLGDARVTILQYPLLQGAYKDLHEDEVCIIDRAPPRAFIVPKIMSNASISELTSPLTFSLSTYSEAFMPNRGEKCTEQGWIPPEDRYCLPLETPQGQSGAIFRRLSDGPFEVAWVPQASLYPAESVREILFWHGQFSKAFGWKDQFTASQRLIISHNEISYVSIY